MRYTIIAFLLLSVGSIAQTDSISYFDNHTNDIRTITYSPDAKFIVSAGWDETIVIQRNDSASEVAQVLMDYRGAVNSIAFSRDGTYMIAGGQDGELKKYAFYSDYFEVAYLDTTLSINNAAISKVLYGPGMRSVYSADKRGEIYGLRSCQRQSYAHKYKCGGNSCRNIYGSNEYFFGIRRQLRY